MLARFKLLSAFIVMMGAMWLSGCQPTGGTSGPVEGTGPWTLAPIESGMSYVTIKNNGVGEINTFREISGRVSPAGEAVFSIALDSLDTANEVRDGRMKEHVFKTAAFPEAVVSAQLDMSAFEALAIGNSKTVALNVNISLAGLEVEEEFYVQVTRLGVNKVVVTNKAPFMIESDYFDFAEGLATLQELAKLESITPVVPVTISLVFTR